MPIKDEEGRWVGTKSFDGSSYGKIFAQFPSDLLNHNAYVKLTAFEVEGLTDLDLKERIEKLKYGGIFSNMTPIKHCFLPIPTTGLNINDGITYNEGSITNMSQLFGTAFLETIRKLGSATMASQQTGYSGNEYIANMFKGIQLRSFEYVWNFIPESQTDADNLINIIEFIRGGALPTYQKNNPVVKHPNIWLIENRVNGKLLIETNYLVIENISTNFDDPTGTTFFKDGNPVKTNLSIKFKEIYPSGNEMIGIL